MGAGTNQLAAPSASLPAAGSAEGRHPHSRPCEGDPGLSVSHPSGHPWGTRGATPCLQASLSPTSSPQAACPAGGRGLPEGPSRVTGPLAASTCHPSCLRCQPGRSLPQASPVCPHSPLPSWVVSGSRPRPGQYPPLHAVMGTGELGSGAPRFGTEMGQNEKGNDRGGRADSEGKLGHRGCPSGCPAPTQAS